MSDTYQAVYDAVRSRFGHCDVGTVVRDAIGSGLDASHAIALIQQDFCVAAAEMQRPSVLYRPELRQDVQTGEFVAWYLNSPLGYGKTPAQAMEAFDKAWRGEKTA